MTQPEPPPSQIPVTQPEPGQSQIPVTQPEPRPDTCDTARAKAKSDTCASPSRGQIPVTQPEPRPSQIPVTQPEPPPSQIPVTRPHRDQQSSLTSSCGQKLVCCHNNAAVAGSWLLSSVAQATRVIDRKSTRRRRGSQALDQNQI